MDSSWQARWLDMIIKLRIIVDAEDERLLLEELSAIQSTAVVGFINAHAMNLLASDRQFFEALSQAEILLRDGSGMAALYRLIGLSPGLNMNGTDLIPRILQSFNGRRVAIWGTQEPYLTSAATQCTNRFGVELVSRHHGFDTIDSYVHLALRTMPNLIVLGMGMPKQEAVAKAIRLTEVPTVIICGGAILDFLGGKVGRAPIWTRNLGVEWLFRFSLEPKRLFKRYFVGNPVFVLRAMSLRQEARRKILR